MIRNLQTKNGKRSSLIRVCAVHSRHTAIRRIQPWLSFEEEKNGVATDMYSYQI